MDGEEPNKLQQSESQRSLENERRLDAEARLRAEHDRFQRIIENTDAGYFRIGMDGCYADVNSAWLRMYGFTRREDAIGLHFSAVQVPEDLAKAEKIVEALVRGESVKSGEFRSEEHTSELQS